MNLEEFVDRLEGVHKTGGGYMARCPAHSDSTASLKVDDGDERILLHCHAGCAQDDILAALGLTWKDIVKNAVNYAEPEAVYQYTDETGALLFEALRFPGKKFRQRHTDPETGEVVWSLEGVRRVIYRLPEVMEAVKQGQTIWICEGEKDVEALRSKGQVATCNPMGAGKWKPEFAQPFSGANVVIVADRDEVGYQHAETVKTSLLGIAKTIMVVRAKRGKDAYDAVITHDLKGEDAFEQVRPRVRRGIVTAKELAEQAIEDLSTREQDNPGFDLLAPAELGLPADSPGITFRKGRMYVVGAYTADGKTSFAQQGTRRLCSQGLRGGYWSLEMSERDLRNRLIAHKGIPFRLLEEPWHLAEYPEHLATYQEAVEEISNWQLDTIFDSNATTEKIAEVTRDREHDFVIVDHIHRFAWGTDRRKLEEQIVGLTNIALEQNVMLIVLSQLRKYQRGKDFTVYPRPTRDDFRETSQLADDASIALAIWRQRDGTGTRYTGETELIVLKNRHRTGPHDETGRTYFPTFDPDRGLFIPKKPTIELPQEEETWDSEEEMLEAHYG